MEDEADLSRSEKQKKNESKFNSQQDVISKAQIFLKMIYLLQKQLNPHKKKQERGKEPILFDHNIDIITELTVRPKERCKQKVEAGSVFDDDVDDVFSGLQVKTSKPTSQPSQAAT